MSASVAIIGEFAASYEPHAQTNAAISHSSAALGIALEPRWISTEDLDNSIFQSHRGLWVAPGSPYRNMERTLDAIRYAREHGVPCLGTCGGFQHMVIEYARNVLGFADAQHGEYDPYASNLFVSRLTCSLVGQQMEVQLSPDSLVAGCYGALAALEQYYCNFGVHPDRAGVIASTDLKVVGRDVDGDVRIIELSRHPFFVGTLFVPQARSLPDKPHPLVTAFVRTIVHNENA